MYNGNLKVDNILKVGLLNMVIQVCLIVLALTFVVIAIYLIPLLIQAKKTAEQAQKTLADLNERTKPLIDQLQATAAKVEKTLDDVNSRTQPILEQAEASMNDIRVMISQAKNEATKIESTVENYRMLADRGHQLANVVYGLLEMPIFRIASNLTALQAGFGIFFKSLINKKKEG